MKQIVREYEEGGVKFKNVSLYDDEGLLTVEQYWVHGETEGLIYTITRQD